MSVYRAHTFVLNFSIFTFTLILVWFAFIYYPKVLRDFKTGNFVKKPLIAPAVAYSNSFPMENRFFKAVYEEKSNTYYVFINGSNLEQYTVNKNSADLTLKSALSMEKLCDLNVIYASTERLKIPAKYSGNQDCK